jgi:hypothetical protein
MVILKEDGLFNFLFIKKSSMLDKLEHYYVKMDGLSHNTKKLILFSDVKFL